MKSGSFLSKLKKNAMFLASQLGNYSFFLPFFKLFPRRFPDITGHDTDICIEGYPRSGNTYFVAAFERWNPMAKIAHHSHMAGSLKQALRSGRPAVVLVRDPDEAVSSVIAWDGLIHPYVGLLGYISFYSSLWRYRDQVLVLDFAEVTTQPDVSIRKINQFFAVEYGSHKLGGGEDERIRAVLRSIDKRHQRGSTNSSLPNSAKQELKLGYSEAVRSSPLYGRATYWCRQFRSLSQLESAAT